jgi:hypothetical protein
VPDVPNWAWHDYGMRVGFWRLLERAAQAQDPATTSINAHVCSLSRASRRPCSRPAGSSWATACGRAPCTCCPISARPSARPSTSLQKFTGKKPKGWLGPGLTETWETLDYLAEAGIEYVSDWVNDDQPYEIRTTRGPLVSVPYSLELNDIPMMVVQHHESTAWVQRCRDQFDRLYAEGAKNPRVMAIAVHPTSTACRTGSKYSKSKRCTIYILEEKKGVWFFHCAKTS